MNNTKNNFNDRCYKILSLIPKGKVTTYGEIARALNSKAYRAVGNAMAKNPNPILVPCHRVVNSNGEIGGYALGVTMKINLLKKEGISIINRELIDFMNIMHKF